ncbi:MAG: hypothetical protein ACXWW0_07675 [Bacteroidia bacterium]
MLSFWERESFLHYDIIIIGSGIVGLSTAISLKEKFRSAIFLFSSADFYLPAPVRAMPDLPVSVR